MKKILFYSFALLFCTSISSLCEAQFITQQVNSGGVMESKFMSNVTSLTPGCNYVYSIGVEGSNLYGCGLKYKTVNVDGLADNTVFELPSGTSLPLSWKNVNANGSLEIELYSCANPDNNGKKASFTKPILNMGTVSNIQMNASSSANLSCGSQAVTFSFTGGQNNSSISWGLSDLTSKGWSIQSSNGTSVTLISDRKETGTVNLTVKKDCQVQTRSFTINRPVPGGGNSYISGPSALCSGSATFTVANAPSTMNNLVWSTNVLSITSSNTSNPMTGTLSYSGNDIVKATFNDACADHIVRQMDVRVGPYNSYEIVVEGPTEVCPGQSAYYFTNIPSTTGYSWTHSANIGYAYSNSGNDYSILSPSTGYNVAQVYVTVSNACGSTQQYKNIYEPYTGCSGGGGDGHNRFTIQPNPSDKEIKVVEIVSDDKNVTELSTSIVEVQLLSNDRLLKTTKMEKGVAIIPVSDIPSGTYFLHIIDKGNTMKRQVVIKH